MGAAATFYLAQTGLKVACIEQFEQSPHHQGSHGGQSRIIRKAYFEHPDYVPLLERAYQNWQQLESLSGEQLYYPTGLLYKGPADHPLLAGVQQSALQFSIPLQEVPDREWLRHFNQQEDDICLFEPGAGFLLPEHCIRLYLDAAEKRGARLFFGRKIRQWKKENGVIEVRTDTETFRAARLIITAGAWAASLLPELRISLPVTRQVLLWLRPDDPAPFLPGHFPCWMQASHSLEGAWYGFPCLSGQAFPGPAGLKMALHHPAKETDPDRVNRKTTPEEVQELLRQARHYFHPANAPVTATATCLYTMSPDGHFIIDYLPGYGQQVVIAAGFSGHGFKFSSVIGEILAEMATRGQTDMPLSFLSLNRFRA